MLIIFSALVLLLILVVCWGYSTRVEITDLGFAPLSNCDECKYDLEGLETEGVCPECGADYRPRTQTLRRRVFDAGRAVVLLSVVASLGLAIALPALGDEMIGWYARARGYSRPETVTLLNRGLNMGWASFACLAFASVVFMAGTKLNGTLLGLSALGAILFGAPLSILAALVLESPDPFQIHRAPGNVVAIVLGFGLVLITALLYLGGRHVWAKEASGPLSGESPPVDPED